MAIGEDPRREGLRDTPRRFADAWREFVEHDPGRVDVTFSTNAINQMVVISGIRVWSVCEHHLMPFWCNVAIGYVATGTVLGLSKFARIAREASHRLQTQEQLTHDVADAVASAAGTGDVAVLARGEHTCMSMRGVRSPALMTTSVVRGVFLDRADARAEFLKFAVG